MTDWNFAPPTVSDMGDHDVPLVDDHLAGKSIALLVSGGIAAIKAPMIARALRRYGARVTAYVTAEALNYTTLRALEWATTNKVIDRLTSDSEHLNKSSPFDAYLVAPATYNTINKFAAGTADGVVTTTLASALGLAERGQTKILVAPTMHGDMHNSILVDSMRLLAGKGVHFLRPRDAYGKHNIPDSHEITLHLCRALSKSPLRGRSLLVTAGPTPVPIDNVRRITNRFKGRLGVEIATQLWLKGADVQLVIGSGGQPSLSVIPRNEVSTYDDYRTLVLDLVRQDRFDCGIFSAAVADYRPSDVVSGKIPSGKSKLRLDLEPTAKVIDEVQKQATACRIVSFKYEVEVTPDALLAEARRRLARGHIAVVANRWDEICHPQGQAAYLVTRENSEQPPKFIGKRGIAQGLLAFLETAL